MRIRRRFAGDRGPGPWGAVGVRQGKQNDECCGRENADHAPIINQLDDERRKFLVDLFASEEGNPRFFSGFRNAFAARCDRTIRLGPDSQVLCHRFLRFFGFPLSR